MEKKKLLIVTAVAALLLIAGGVFAALHFSSKGEANADNKAAVEKSESSIALDDTLLFYVNLGQLGEKSAINEVLTDANRSLLANILSGGVVDSNYVEMLLSNLSASGLDIDKPIYSYANIVDDNIEVVAVAEVADADKVDSFIEFAAEIIGENLDVEREGNTREFSIEDLYFSYNDKRFIVCCTSDYSEETDNIVKKAMKRAKPNLSAYANYDLAVSLKIMPLFEVVRSVAYASIQEYYEYLDYADEWEREWMMENIRSQEQALKQMEEIAEQMDKNASITMGLSFENGKIVVDALIDGVSYDYACCQVTNDHLANIDGNTIGLFNCGIDGKKASALISELITSDYAEMFGLSRNEFNIYFGVVCDAIESINGDVTFALNDFNPYSGEVEAVVAVDVDDDYIFSNVDQFGGAFFDKKSANEYGLSYGSNDISLGQKNDILYVTINNKYEKQRNSVADRDWVDELNNSCGYLVVDIDNLMKNSYISRMFENELYYLDATSAELVSNFVESCNYAYISTNSPTSAQLVFAFDDQNTNSLEQIVRMFLPAIISEVTQNMF